jgi:hypothetical protein
VELGGGALEHEQTLDSTANINSLALARYNLNVTGFRAVAVEGVWVWLAINSHAGPAVDNDLDVCSVDVLVSFDEVVAEDAGKQLRWSDWVLLGGDVDGVLHRISGYYHTVVGSGVTVDD